MRVHVFNLLDGKKSIMIEPSRGKGLAPVVLHDVTIEDLKRRLLPVVQRMRGQDPQQPPE